MKKKLTLALAAVLLVQLLCACGAPSARSEATLPPEELWWADLHSHWRQNEMEEISEEGPHTLQDSACTVCGAEVVDAEGETWVTLTNSLGDMVLWLIYDETGALVQNTRTVYTYDSEGNWLTETIYEFDRLSLEAEYTIVSTEEGEDIFASRIITHQEDGSRLEEAYEYGVDGYLETLFDAEGQLVYSYNVVYEFREDGYMTLLRKTEGDTVVLESRYEYDDLGNPTLDQTYSYGQLVREDIYTVVTDSEGFTYSYLSRIVIYNEDGTTTVTEFDEFGESVE